MNYHIFREFADSWAALGLLIIFVGAVVFAFRPGSGRVHRDIAGIPFRNEDRPAPAPRGPTL
ncbi:cbb3-type cytochrome c oxidase subunit 3 [Paenirhodobacter sp.]|jgi:cytochrome c oxidase cbb3-type subunit 4|uniref:cbb3-type cytochrome c oxidase subunit 3 n=1 Tax=Paenirhodobacter sp. TaxID=1965326 RepID=UPI003B50ED2A